MAYTIKGVSEEVAEELHMITGCKYFPYEGDLQVCYITNIMVTVSAGYFNGTNVINIETGEVVRLTSSDYKSIEIY